MHQSVYSNLFLKKKKNGIERGTGLACGASATFTRWAPWTFTPHLRQTDERESEEKDTRVLCFFRQLTSNPHKKGETVVFQRTKWIEKVANPHFVFV
jgi:hypothetical protein